MVKTILSIAALIIVWIITHFLLLKDEHQYTFGTDSPTISFEIFQKLYSMNRKPWGVGTSCLWYKDSAGYRLMRFTFADWLRFRRWSKKQRKEVKKELRRKGMNNG